MNKPLSWFKMDPNQPRKSFSEPELRSLGESMKAHGQLQPVVAKPDGTILCGERRLRAAQLVGMTELAVIIAERPLSDSEVRVVQLTENMHRADLSGYEKWLACSELMGMHSDWQLKDLAANMKFDASMATRIMSPSRCISEVQDALKEAKIGISDCYAISRLPESEQAALLALKLSGASRDDLERASRKQRNGTASAVKMSRVKIAMPNKASVVLSGNELSMSGVVELLVETLKEARKAADQYDVKTFVSMMKDKAKAG